MNSVPYISRKQAEDFVAKFHKALSSPDSSPLLFQVYGFGGVGKTTLTQKLKQTHNTEADFAEISFGLTPDIETPIKLMQKLYELLPKATNLLKKDVLDIRPSDFASKPDPFKSTYEKYQQTIYKLTTQPVEGEQVESEQENTVKDLVELGTRTTLAVGTSFVAPEIATNIAIEGIPKAMGMLSNASQSLKPTKEKIQKLLQQHPETKDKLELQELMLEPIPKLTQAFAEGLIQKTQRQKRSIVLLLDTYEKAPADIDTWLWQYLLEDTPLKSYPVRIIVAGRRSLQEKDNWRKLQQDRNLIYEQRLNEFDKKQTDEYLKQIGITKPGDIQKIYKATKGLPYYLNWIRREKEAGRETDFSRGNQAIVELLLQGLNKKQKEIVQLAACCRWFDRPLIQSLMQRQGIDFETAASDSLNCFDWLNQCDFVEFVQGHYRLDDVARDVFRLSLYQENRNLFRETHELLAIYFEQLAKQEVSADSPPLEKYENGDWRKYTAEFLYYALFARKEKGKRQFISYLFASTYLKQIEVVMIPFAAIAAEAEVDQNSLLPDQTGKFLKKITLVLILGWLILDEEPAKYEINYENETGPSKEEIEAAISPCLNEVEFLEDGLGKYAGLLFKSLRSRLSQQVDLLKEAKVQAEKIASQSDREFSSRLFFNISKRLFNLERYEEALNSIDKALSIKDDIPELWLSRSLVLLNLERYEEALNSTDKGLSIKDDIPELLINRSSALLNLERYEEALNSIDKGLSIKDDIPELLLNRSLALLNLERYEEALNSIDKGLSIKDDIPELLLNRSLALLNLERYEEALNSTDKGLSIKDDIPELLINRSSALLKLERYEEALNSIDKVLSIKDDIPELWQNRCAALLNLERYEEALNSINKVLSIKDDIPELWHNRCTVLRYLHFYQDALVSIDNALNIDPKNPRFLNIKGLILSLICHYDEALAYIDETLKLEPKEPLLWANKGIVLARAGRYQEAMENCEKSLELNPENESGYYGKACCYVLQGNVDLAIVNLQQAIKINAKQCQQEAKYNPDFDSIRNDERFQKLLQG